MNTITQSLSLGEMLAQAREEKGVSLEQAAHDTKIRVAQLREMESDNAFHFSHSSYARFFLRDYATYLGISRSRIEEFLPDTGECSSAGMEYLNGYAKEEVSRAFYRLSVPSSRRVAPLTVLAGVVFAVLILTLGIYVWHSHNVSKQQDKTLIGDDHAKPISAPAVHSATLPEQNAPAANNNPQQPQKDAGAPLASIQPAFSGAANTR